MLLPAHFSSKPATAARQDLVRITDGGCAGENLRLAMCFRNGAQQQESPRNRRLPDFAVGLHCDESLGGGWQAYILGPMDSPLFFSSLKRLVVRLEGWWFDLTRSVQTSGVVKAFGRSKVIGEMRDSLTYIPVRISNARCALRELPISDHSRYTFIDMGSGKGRMLFLAAELPFRRVQGVEFVTDLHERACDNIRRYNRRRSKCVEIESVNANAADFEFPNENLVINIFNPFGPEVLGRMLTNLNRSLQRYPRHVIILLVYPKLSSMIAQMQPLHLYRQTRRHHIYQT